MVEVGSTSSQRRQYAKDACAIAKTSTRPPAAQMALSGAVREVIHNHLEHLRNRNFQHAGPEGHQQAHAPAQANRARVGGQGAGSPVALGVVDGCGNRFGRRLEERVAALLSCVRC